MFVGSQDPTGAEKTTGPTPSFLALLAPSQDFPRNVSPVRCQTGGGHLFRERGGGGGGVTLTLLFPHQLHDLGQAHSPFLIVQWGTVAILKRVESTL